MSARPLSTRAWLRALAITCVIAVHGLYAMPSPVRVNRADLDSPEGRDEVTRWLGLLHAVGVSISREELERETMAWTKSLASAHWEMKKPFQPAFRVTGTGQAWALFANPDSHPHRLEVYVREAGVWRPVYRRNHPELDWLDPVFRYRRVRAVYDGSTGKAGAPYWNFTRWVARRAMLEWPDVDAVRVQMVRTHTTLPGEPLDPAEAVRLQHVHERTAILPDDGLVP